MYFKSQSYIERLKHFTKEELMAVPCNEKLRNILNKIPHVWNLLSQYHFKKQPLPGQDEACFFRGEFYFQKFKNTKNYHDLEEALSFNNYQALEYASYEAISNGNIEKALEYIQKAADIYFSAGYILQANIYEKIAIACKDNNKKKDYIIEAMICFNLAGKLVGWQPSGQLLEQTAKQDAKESSKIALRNCGIKIDLELREAIVERYSKIINLDKHSQEDITHIKNYIFQETESRYRKIKLPEEPSFTFSVL